MDRRNFFKIVSTVSAGAATIACEKNKSDALIPLLVPDHQVVPGQEEWHPSICTSCQAGCGVILRVMPGERIIERNQQKFREPIACVKKIEGNPLDSVSGGRLCARGQAAVQSLYHPDRLTGPMRRSGPRGEGRFTPVSWPEAIAAVSEKLAAVHAADQSKILFLTAAANSSRHFAIQSFLDVLGAPASASCSLAELSVEKKASELFFGLYGLPRYDLANARYALGVGADFLGSWASPVYYARRFGHFRQGRPGLRGKLVQAESRMSLTAASADEWLPLMPGSEPQFLIAIARLLLDNKLTRNTSLDSETILTAKLAELIHSTGLPEKRMQRIARELGESEAPLVIAAASVVHTNSLQAILAAHHLNQLLGNLGKPGGVFAPSSSIAPPPLLNIPQALKQARILLLDAENPAYTYPSTAETLNHIETIISFGGFIDDSAAYADFILPDHHAIESELAMVSPTAATTISLTVATPFVRPLHDTRSIVETLSGLAGKLGLPYTPITAKGWVESNSKETDTWENITRRGGLWPDQPSAAVPEPQKPVVTWPEAEFSGTDSLHFQPYLSLQYHDGSGANLPWMQELPDPTSSAMWNLPVEIDPKTAAKLNISNGDWLRVESGYGSIEAQAYIHPAAIPGVVSMAIGEGHSNYGRYATRRGANPLTLLSPTWEPATGALASGATRVKLAKLDRSSSELTQFSPSDREQGPWGQR